MSKIYQLQNGSDIRGIAYENNIKEVNFTLEYAESIAQAFIIWLRKKYHKECIEVSIGIDSRITGEKFKNRCMEAITSQGCNVIDCDIATTPAMFMTTILDDYKCDGAVMITASHLPYYYNGMKFFTKEGGLEESDITDILDIASNIMQSTYQKKGLCKSKNLIEDYSNMLLSYRRRGVNSSDDFDKPLMGLNILVDAGNGSGGFFATKVLKELGACVDGSQFLEPDGMFPNHIPNPENKESMKSISEAVLRCNGDLGIIFDTDVDRAAIVDNRGSFINKNLLIALISSIVLEENPKSYIVTDSITSEGLSKFIESKEGYHHRYKRGYKNVINEAKRLNNSGKECFIAIETSGHAALKENYFLDDGAYLIAKILIKLAKLSKNGKKLHELIRDLEIPKEEGEYRIAININEYKNYANNILEDLEVLVESIQGWSKEYNNYEGIRVRCDKNTGDGWFLLRLSLHEPLLALNIESDTVGNLECIYNRLKRFLIEYEFIEI